MLLYVQYCVDMVVNDLLTNWASCVCKQVLSFMLNRYRVTGWEIAMTTLDTSNIHCFCFFLLLFVCLKIFRDLLTKWPEMSELLILSVIHC